MSENRKGRVESALDQELVAPGCVIGKAERAALRAQARAVDVAERQADPVAVSNASRVYLDLRTAARLTAATAAEPVDAFDALLAQLGRPTAGAGDAPPA